MARDIIKFDCVDGKLVLNERYTDNKLIIYFDDKGIVSDIFMDKIKILNTFNIGNYYRSVSFDKFNITRISSGIGFKSNIDSYTYDNKDRVIKIKQTRGYRSLTTRIDYLDDLWKDNFKVIIIQTVSGDSYSLDASAEIYEGGYIFFTDKYYRVKTIYVLNRRFTNIKAATPIILNINKKTPSYIHQIYSTDTAEEDSKYIYFDTSKGWYNLYSSPLVVENGKITKADIESEFFSNIPYRGLVRIKSYRIKYLKHGVNIRIFNSINIDQNIYIDEFDANIKIYKISNNKISISIMVHFHSSQLSKYSDKEYQFIINKDSFIVNTMMKAIDNSNMIDQFNKIRRLTELMIQFVVNASSINFTSREEERRKEREEKERLESIRKQKLIKEQLREEERLRKKKQQELLDYIYEQAEKEAIRQKEYRAGIRKIFKNHSTSIPEETSLLKIISGNKPYTKILNSVDIGYEPQKGFGLDTEVFENDPDWNIDLLIDDNDHKLLTYPGSAVYISSEKDFINDLNSKLRDMNY